MPDEFVTKEMCHEKHETAVRECDLLRRQLYDHERKIQEADVRFAELAGDVRHIKDRIDNGLSKTVNEIKEQMNGFMPLVKESADWADKFKQAVFFISVVSVGGGIVSLAFYLMKMFTGGRE